MSNLIGFDKPQQKRKRVGIVIQARMTSTRFPGKSMALLNGKPVIQHVIEEAKKIRPNDVVILAVPDTPESDPMVELANELGIENSAGSELNVLERYYGTAQHFGLNVIVRITGDCPFISAPVCNEVLQLLVWRKLDYACNCYPERTYPKGMDCEAFTFDCLEAAYLSANVLDQGDFEHVTPWMQRTKEVRKACVRQMLDASDQNWCVDYPEDIARLEKLPPRKVTIGGVQNDQ